MNYFIARDGQHYGPYTLADLQRYVASGEISLTDMATSEGMPAPVPVGQIVGNIAAPVAYQTGPPVAPAVYYPDPPNLHWGLVLLFGAISYGLFTTIWDIVQAAWMKKVDPESKALPIYIGAAISVAIFYLVTIVGAINNSPSPFVYLFAVVNFVLIIVGRFSLKSSLEKHFNQAEPMGLLLSGVMTFFFGTLYFQYHFNDINKRKVLDRMYAANR